MQLDSDPIVAGRRCGTCTLCCKLLKIAELSKPEGSWCAHCKPGKGCTIYARRPQECSSFHCGYLVDPTLDDEWKPNRCKFVLVSELDGNRIAAYVDAQHADAWRREPYYSQLKRWAIAAIPHQGQVVVCARRRTFVIFPDRDVDLGIVGDDERIVTGVRKTAWGIELNAYKLHKDDPRAQGLAD